MRRRSGSRRVVLTAAIALIALAIAIVRLLERDRPPDSAGRLATPVDPAAIRELFAALEKEDGRSVDRRDVASSDAVDGDTVALPGGERLRYLAIDAPERDAPFFDEAATLNRRLVGGRPMTVFTPRDGGRDRFGRILAAVFVEGASDAPAGAPVLVNAVLVEAGLARVYLKDDDEVSRALRPLVIDAQARAMARGAGIWSLPGARGREPVLATRDRFHRPDCRHIRGRSGPFVPREEALRQGKSPCRTCNP